MPSGCGGLDDENANPKKLRAEQMLDAAALRELLAKMVWPAAEREGVAYRVWHHLTSESNAALSAVEVNANNGARPSTFECPINPKFLPIERLPDPSDRALICALGVLGSRLGCEAAG
jgi:hypothetical protein